VGFAVKANPDSGPRTGSLAIAGQVFKVTQAGARQYPLIAVEPLGVDFGFVRRGMSATRNLTVANKGTAPLTIREITIGGKNPGVFTSDQTCRTLAPGERCTISVRFAPVSRGVLKGILKIQSDAAGRPEVQVPLIGRGL
jgi:hypothetical protein